MHAHRAVDCLTSYIIGNGIVPHSDNQQIDDFLKQWADTVYCDQSQHTNLYGLQSLAVKHLIIDGEVFIQKIISKLVKSGTEEQKNEIFNFYMDKIIEEENTTNS